MSHPKAMSDHRAAARVAGLLFLLTHVTSVGAVVAYGTAGEVARPLAGRGWRSSRPSRGGSA